MDRQDVSPVQIIRGNALALPLADDSVDLVVTSPPYFGLRSYQDGGEHYSGQIGDEPTPAEFVDALIAATAEMVRVVKPSGSIWVNLGDKYARNGGGGRGSSDGETGRGPRPASLATGAPEKSLIGIPWRYAIRCIDDLGLILRAEVIWSKPNGLPESVTDRVRRSHEQWFHFTKEPRYYSAVDEVREEYSPATESFRRMKANYTDERTDETMGRRTGQTLGRDVDPHGGLFRSAGANNPLGKLPGSVWDIRLGNTLVRDILDAVAAGALTPDEGERLWTSASDSWDTLTLPASAGNGSAGRTHAATERPRPTSSHGPRTGHTESPTGSSSDPSLTGSPSTTPAATSPASGLSTSSPLPAPRTSAEHGPSAHPAHRGTASTTPTPSAPGTGRSPSGAAPATSPESTHADSVWVVPTEPLRVPDHLGIDHFAAFPTEFPRRIITGWSPRGICVECGEGRRPTSTGQRLRNGEPTSGRIHGAGGRHEALLPRANDERTIVHITGEACACPEPTAPTRPGVVLDPFGGTGTTALVAEALGRHGISNDLSADYCRLARWRTSDPKQRDKAAS